MLVAIMGIMERLARCLLDVACAYHLKSPLVSFLACHLAFKLTPSVYALLEPQNPAKRRLVVEICKDTSHCAIAIFAHQSLKIDFSREFSSKMVREQDYAVLHKQSFHRNHYRELFLLPGFLSGLFSSPSGKMVAEIVQQLTLDATNCREMLSLSLVVNWFLSAFEENDDDDDIKWHTLRALGNLALHDEPGKVILQSELLNFLLRESKNPQAKNHTRRAACWVLGNLQHTHAVEFQPHWEDENFDFCKSSKEFERRVGHCWQVKRNALLLMFHSVLPKDLVRGELVNMLY